MRRLAALLLLVVPACVLDSGRDSPFHDKDPALVLPGPDAMAGPDAVPVDTTSCAVPLPCPDADPGKISVCGRLYDVETDAEIRAVTESAGVCEPGGATGGACDLQLGFYDAIAFAGDPTTATQLPRDSLRLDDCGRFVAHNVKRPDFGYLGIGVDDAGGAPDLRRLTGVAFAVISQEVRSDARAYSIRRTTDQAWTDSAGLTGSTFVDRGAVWKLFLDGATPTAGVQITGVNGAPRAPDDYYFSDTGAFTRSTIAPAQTVTGGNGSGLMINSGLVEHSGEGGERGSCTWSSHQAAAIQGVLLYAPSTLQSGGQPCR